MKPIYRILLWLIFFITGLALLSLAIGKTSAIITVNYDGSSDYSKIQYAIDNATEGDTIFVHEGTYYENAVVNKSVSLIGNGSANTTIDGGGNGDVVRITADWVNISGFEITGSGSGYNAGIVVESNYTNIFQNNCSNNFFGIYLAESSYNKISNNTANLNDIYGIFLSASSTNILIDNICRNNNYGIVLLDASNHNTISNNLLSENNIGIYLWNSPIFNTISNNICLNNHHDGIATWVSFNNTISYNTCLNNNDVAINLFYDSTDNIVSNNSCSNNSYGIRISDSNNNILTFNTISENAVGMYLEYSSKNNIVHYNNIYNNTEFSINATDNSGYTIDATNNWWGDPSGPYHPVNNSQGKGDNITDYVIFDAWLGKPGDYRPPKAIIDSISPDLAMEGKEVYFLGHGEAYKSITRHVWHSSINGELHNGTSPTFSISNLSNGTHTISLRVRDDYEIWSEKVTATLTINGLPRAHIDSIDPNPAQEGQAITFRGSGTDDGTIVRYVWRTDDNVLYSGTNASFTLSNLSMGNHTIYLKVQDNLNAWSGEVSAALTITPNKIPTVSIISPEDGEKVKGKVTIKGTASDEDGNVEKVEISINKEEWLPAFGTGTWSFEWDTSRVKNGEYIIKVRCYDGSDYSDEITIAITVENKEDNGNGGIIPGFGLLISIGALIISAAYFTWKKTS